MDQYIDERRETLQARTCQFPEPRTPMETSFLGIPSHLRPFSLRPHSRTGEFTHVINKTLRTSFIHQPLLNKALLKMQARGLCHMQT